MALHEVTRLLFNDANVFCASRRHAPSLVRRFDRIAHATLKHNGSRAVFEAHHGRVSE